MHAVELIERKRNGEELSAAEVREFIATYVRGDVPDYQAAAFLMAVWFRGLTPAETYAMTDAMVASGDTVDLAARLGRRVVDKHSTGGVGDKITIAVGPVVAACGVPFGKMSGRGLGHTGGTLDKLESIPGFRVELTTDELVEQTREIGIAVAGQTADLVPADKKLYRLRDVTATIDQVSLIAASIMSKKIAAGASAVVLDVKVGEGAFMRTVDDARELAEEMRALGMEAGMDVVCVLTDMDQPLGRAVGNALEVREAWETVSGGGPADTRELVVDAAAQLLALSDLGVDEDEGRQRAEAVLEDGSALATYDTWVRAQGGDPDPALLPVAPVVREVAAPASGFVHELGAREVAITAMELGAGREVAGQQIDHAVGIVCLRKRGEEVTAGEPLAEIHARDEAAAQRAEASLLAAYEIGDGEGEPRPLVLEVIR
ncbi:MAG TPA: thymidine phosphorylase [Gaiellaceae bacterium]|nr:thymidine phosphorylase [Gaiellaceae bacterium]